MEAHRGKSGKMQAVGNGTAHPRSARGSGPLSGLVVSLEELCSGTQ